MTFPPDPSWFLVGSGGEEGVPDFQESAEHGEISQAAWMLQQDRQAHCE